MSQTDTPVQPKRYAWIGENRIGKRISGVLYGESKLSIRQQLAQRGIIPLKINQTREPIFRGTSRAQVTQFLNELATLYVSGVPLLRILTVLSHSQKNLYFKNVIETVRADIERGEPLHQALRHHPQEFDQLTCNMVESGEAAGELDKVLFNITHTQERRNQLNAQIKTALAYPAFVIGVAFVIWVALLVGVVPVFEGIYKSSGKSLPWLTQALLNTSRLIRNNWLMITAIIGGLILYFSQTKSDKWHQLRDEWLLKLPVIGSLMSTAWHAQFARTLGLLYGAGIPLHQALTISARTIPNTRMRQAIYACGDDILQGHSLSLSMSQHAFFEQHLIQRIQIGEESGKLAVMLQQHAERNEFMVEQTVKRLSSLIEPFLVLVIGLIVAVMVISLYWPILNLGSALK